MTPTGNVSSKKTIQFYNSPPIPTPSEGLMGEMKAKTQTIWEGAKQKVSAVSQSLLTNTRRGLKATTSTAARPLIWAGTNLGTGVASGVKTELEPMLQPEGPLGAQLKQSVEQALLRQPPEELLSLKDGFDKLIQNPDTIEFQDLKSTHDCLERLLAENAKLLKQLAPDLELNQIELCRQVFNLFPKSLSNKKNTKKLNPNQLMDAFKTKLKSSQHKESFTRFKGLYDTILSQNQGVLIQSLAYLQEALVSEENGVLVQAVEVLKRKCIDEDTGLIKQVVTELNQLLNQKGGPIDTLATKLTEGDESIISQAVQLLQKKLLDDDGIVNEIANRFNGKENGIITEALTIARTHMTSMLEDSLSLLKERLTNKDNGILTEGIALLNRKLAGEGGIVADSVHLLENMLTGKDGVIENFQRQLFDEQDGMLTQALARVQDKLNNEKTGILTESVNLLEKKLLAESGVVDRIEKKLTDEENGVLANACKTLKGLLQKKDGPLNILGQELQKTLANALVILKEKCLNDQDSFLAQTLEKLNQKLQAEDGVLDTLSKRLNDPDVGMLASAINTFNRKLLDENGTFSLLEKKLLDQSTGLLPRAIVLLEKKIQDNIDLLNKRLNEEGGAIDQAMRSVQRRLIDKDGILDTAMHLLEERLSDQDKGILVQAKKFLSDALLDDRNGIIAQAMDVLNKKLTEKDGLLSHLEFRLTDTESGILTKAVNFLRKTITDALDSPLSRVENMLSRVENLPNTMLNSALGRNPSARADTAPPDGPPEEGTVSDFLTQGSLILKAMIEKGGQAVSKQALSSLSSVLSLGLKQVLEKVDNSEAYRQPKAALQEAISTLATLPENGNWSQLYATLKQASEVLNGVKLYVNGFSIPQIGPSAEGHPSAESHYSENIARLQEVIDLPVQEPNSQNWENLANAEKGKLVSNTVNFLTIKHIFENVCHLKPDSEKFYLDLLSEAQKKGKDSKSELKKLFFEALDKKQVHFFTKIYAQIQYYFYGEFVDTFTTRASDIYFKEIFEYIKAHKAEKFTTLRNQITTNFTRYLTILGGAYKSVANQAVATGTLEEMLRKELEKKESNLGFETKELYIEFMLSVLKKPLNFSFIPSFLPSSISHFFSNVLSWFVGKMIGNPEQIVRAIIDKTAQSLQDTHGYTHALNTVIHEQLDEIWKILQTNYSNEQAGRPSEIDLEISEVKKEQLAKLVKNLFEVLRKTQCHTVAELQELCQGRLLSANVHRAVDDLFIEDVLEKVTHMLAVSIQSLIQENQLQKLTYKFASLANRTFEINEGKITPEQMHRQERKISERCEQILRFVTRTAVKEKLDFSGEKQQNKTNHFIQELHTRSRTYFAKAEQDLAALLETADIATATAKDKIDKCVKEAMDYQSNCSESSFQAKSSKINSSNRDEIAKCYSGVAEKSKPFVEAVASLEQHAKTLEDLRICLPHLNQIQTTLVRIDLQLFKSPRVNLEKIQFAENQMKNLKTHLEELKKNRNIAQQCRQISAETQAIDTILTNIRKDIETRTLGLKPIQPNSFINIAAEKNKYELSARRIKEAIAATRLLEPDTHQNAANGAREAIVRARQHLQTLSLWEEEQVKPIPYINFSIADMKGMQDWASDIVYGRVRERLDGLVGFLKREETYRYGLLNHLFLIPYVQAAQRE
jgi:hypothetical protein